MNDIFFGVDNKNNSLIIFCWCSKLYCDVLKGEVCFLQDAHFTHRPSDKQGKYCNAEAV